MFFIIIFTQKKRGSYLNEPLFISNQITIYALTVILRVLPAVFTAPPHVKCGYLK